MSACGSFRITCDGCLTPIDVPGETLEAARLNAAGAHGWSATAPYPEMIMDRCPDCVFAVRAMDDIRGIHLEDLAEELRDFAVAWTHDRHIDTADFLAVLKKKD